MHQAQKTRKVQERALGFINNDHTSSLNGLFKSTNTQLLHVRRIKQIACEVFKIINKMSPEYINDLVEIKTLTYNFREKEQAEVPRVKTTRYGLRSFRSEAARVWNRLPNELRVAESYPQFRRLIHSWDSPICGCPLCSTRLWLFLLFSFCLLLVYLLFWCYFDCLCIPYFSLR